MEGAHEEVEVSIGDGYALEVEPGEGREVRAIDGANRWQKEDAAQPAGRMLKSAKRGRPLWRRVHALGKQRVVRMVEVARMLPRVTVLGEGDGVRRRRRGARGKERKEKEPNIFNG
jgi:hypothetical protein